MTQVTFKGQPIQLDGNLPPVGAHAPHFTLTKTDLTELDSKSLLGSKIVLNIFPSLDTPTCALSVKRFNQEASNHQDVKILCISMDLPFAQKRFCGAEGLDHVMAVSAFRNPDFAENYGVKIISAPLNGLLSRSVILIDEQGKIEYVQQVREISQEPDYEAVLALL